MTKYTHWSDIRAAHVERAGGEQAVEAGRQALLAGVAPNVGRGVVGGGLVCRYPDPSTRTPGLAARPNGGCAGMLLPLPSRVR